MNRSTLLAASVVCLLSAPGMADVDRIAEIDVTADLAAVQNEAAAAYWGSLETDLEAAIAARVTDRLSADGTPGARVLVDIREVELASAFDRAINLGDAVLVGQVNIVDDTDNQNFDAYELSVSLENARIIVPEGQTLILNSDDRASYERLIETFADGVVARLN